MFGRVSRLWAIALLADLGLLGVGNAFATGPCGPVECLETCAECNGEIGACFYSGGECGGSALVCRAVHWIRMGQGEPVNAFVQVYCNSICACALQNHGLPYHPVTNRCVPNLGACPSGWDA